MSIMKRYMKQGRINFFESPHPRHIDFNHLRDNRYPFSEDPENHEERLFLTPLQHHPTHTPRPHIDPYFTHHPSKRTFTEDLFLDNSEPLLHEEDSPHSLLAIDQKLEYSEEEELLLPLTPEKVLVVEEENLNTTARKDYEAHSSSLAESRFYERGLKKLAYEAFQFVSQQKKTTYKEVATNLISKINDQKMLDAHKKGEMNIKRRVYDALNVLIALGLLKRNGNKILGKKHDSEAIFLERDTHKENQRKKEEVLEDELQVLRSDYKARMDTLRQKQSLVSKLKEKINKMKEITDRNIYNESRMQQEGEERRENIVPLPFLGVCLGEKSQQRMRGGSSDLLMNQKSQDSLQLVFNSEYNLQLLGDLDLIEHYYTPVTEMKTPVKEKKKTRK